MGAGHWRPGGLLGSPFNVKWRFSAPALAAILEFLDSFFIVEYYSIE
jgi:hypothetical protein